MRIEKINNEEYIILEENDTIKIALPNKVEKLVIRRTNNKLDVLGNADIVNYIKGNGMLAKLEMKPFTSKEDIIKKCDDWFEKYKVVYDEFKELINSSNYFRGTYLRITEYETVHLFKDDIDKGTSIILNPNSYLICSDNVSIDINYNNSDILAYVLAIVLDHFISKNYNNEIVSYNRVDDKSTLYSVNRKEDFEITAECNIIYIPKQYDYIINEIINIHNKGESSKDFIDILKKCILDQPLDSKFRSSIDRTNILYDRIISEKEQQPKKQAIKSNKI